MIELLRRGFIEGAALMAYVPLTRRRAPHTGSDGPPEPLKHRARRDRPARWLERTVGPAAHRRWELASWSGLDGAGGLGSESPHDRTSGGTNRRTDSEVARRGARSPRPRSGCYAGPNRPARRAGPSLSAQRGR